MATVTLARVSRGVFGCAFASRLNPTATQRLIKRVFLKGIVFFLKAPRDNSSRTLHKPVIPTRRELLSVEPSSAIRCPRRSDDQVFSKDSSFTVP
jgi:hypothetical protein